ncbi:hypothetical protein [Tatumella morbirosei]|uniref:hypothetical protein n=1 Tax=Tatumella morbirosei TaxID=642227 RepID=UPI001FE2077A|nr:hypothetical protein [Tatumella morbirosei]
MVNFGGQAAGFVSPLVIGFIVSATHSYQNVFLFLLGAIAVAIATGMTLSGSKIREVQLANAHEA